MSVEGLSMSRFVLVKDTELVIKLQLVSQSKPRALENVNEEPCNNILWFYVTKILTEDRLFG